MTKKTTGLELKTLNLSEAQEKNTFKFNYRDETGKETDFVIEIVGRDAPSVQAKINKENNRRRNQAAIDQKKGKVSVELVENDIEFGTKMAAWRIVGWSGLFDNGADVPFSEEMAIWLCENNALIFEQVVEHGNNILNFTKSKLGI